jgi:uncharacterized protein (TIGR02466 family)
MNVETWFPVPIWNIVTSVSDTQNQQAIDFCLNLKSRLDGRTVSNAGGWQSQDLLSSDLLGTPLAPIVDEVLLPACQQAMAALGSTKKLKTANFWVNINGKGHFNLPHSHDGSVLSGVFYLTNENSSIAFTRQKDVFDYFLQTINSDYSTPLSFFEVKYTPIKNSLLIFPSWLWHSVERNDTDQDRISIAFNTGFA